ncbi:MAG TPA: phage tail sheath C-terminal domain-containing protein [Rhizomicrobium sp.]
MPLYDTPGTYIEREDRAQGGINRLRTDVAAFVGIAERGPSRRAVAIDSWKQFVAIFGSFIVHGYLAYAVRAYFENGGRRCWVVRVESEAAHIASARLNLDGSGLLAWEIQANSAGAWGNALSARLVESRRVMRRAMTASADWGQLDSIAGFSRADTIELIQDIGGVVQREQRVISLTDPVTRRLIWNHPDPEIALGSDAPLALLDPSRPLRIERLTYQLQVSNGGKPWRIYDELALSPMHTRYGPNIVNGVAGLFAPDRSRGVNIAGLEPGSTRQLVTFGKRGSGSVVPEPVRIIDLRPSPETGRSKLSVPNAALVLGGGADGLSSLDADCFIGLEDDTSDSDSAVLANRYGIAALGEIDEISIVAVPDIHIQPRSLEYAPFVPCSPDPCLPSPGLPATPIVPQPDDAAPQFSQSDIDRVAAALVIHCERHRDRVALIDPPFVANQENLGIATIQNFRTLFDSSYAAMYFPWIEMLDALGGSRSDTIIVPPSGHVAGLIAATDLRIGVHKAPANIPLLMAEGAAFALDDAKHGLLNLDGINVIRSVSGRGLRVAGARTLSSNSDFRFLNVRRLMLTIERSLESSLQWAVFEGNDWLTRAKIKLMIEGYLRALWSSGALMGAVPDEAYSVRCDEINNTADSRARGELLIEITIAPSVPFEFVVLRIGRGANGFEISENAQDGS